MDIKPALPFNCIKCSAGIGDLCKSKATGKPMARYYHPGRIPREVRSEYDQLRLEQWLAMNGRLFMEHI